MAKSLQNKSKIRADKKTGQFNMLAKMPLAYGGELLKTRKGRAQPRTLSTKDSMHLVLRSTKAKGPWSFSRDKNKAKIAAIFKKFARKYGVRISSIAYVGNHLHAQIQLSSRHTYRAFIRAVTAAIAMAITGVSRWNKNAICASSSSAQKNKLDLENETIAQQNRFWDYRPFTRIVRGWKALLNLKDYIEINRFEGFGYNRGEAQFLVEQDKNIRAGPFADLA